jgi:3-oxoacyl-[acyl-carrier protein] reductase
LSSNDTTTDTSGSSADGRGRVAIVTGGSRGIGRATVERLAAAGYSVVVGYGREGAEAEAAVAAAREAGAEAFAVAADVGDADAVAALFDQTEVRFGRVDVVVHAAGKLALAPLTELDLDQLDELHRVNIRGTFVVDQQAARRVRAGGSIVNFSTTVVALGFPTYGAYSASKGAVEALTPILARELRGRDVTVNTVAPGPTATALFLDGKDQATIDKLAAGPPLERLGTPEDIARVVAFLVGPEGHWVNGQTVRANGGLA